MADTGAPRARAEEAAPPPEPGLRVLLVRPRSGELPAILYDLGFHLAAQAGDGPQAEAMGRFVKADVALVDCRDADPADRDFFESRLPRADLPLVVLWDGGPPPPARELAGRGVYSCLSGECEPQALASALEAAARGFGQARELRERAGEMAASLAERKLLGRATGLLMDREGLSEAQAGARLRRQAQDQGRSLSSVAEAVIERLEVRREPRRRVVRPGGRGSRPG